jgi:hypothetical protein
MIRLTGQNGEIRHGYQRAAVIKKWTLEHETIEGTPSEVHPFWIEQRPLDVSLDLGRARWKWRNVQLLECAKVVRLRVKGSPNK